MPKGAFGGVLRAAAKGPRVKEQNNRESQVRQAPAHRLPSLPAAPIWWTHPCLRNYAFTHPFEEGSVAEIAGKRYSLETTPILIVIWVRAYSAQEATESITNFRVKLRHLARRVSWLQSLYPRSVVRGAKTCRSGELQSLYPRRVVSWGKHMSQRGCMQTRWWSGDVTCGVARTALVPTIHHGLSKNSDRGLGDTCSTRNAVHSRQIPRCLHTTTRDL